MADTRDDAYHAWLTRRADAGRICMTCDHHLPMPEDMLLHWGNKSGRTGWCKRYPAVSDVIDTNSCGEWAPIKSLPKEHG